MCQDMHAFTDKTTPLTSLDGADVKVQTHNTESN